MKKTENAPSAKNPIFSIVASMISKIAMAAFVLASPHLGASVKIPYLPESSLKRAPASELARLPASIGKGVRRYAADILGLAGSHGVDPALVAGIIWTESTFNRKAVSRARAYGLMQLKISTAREMCLLQKRLDCDRLDIFDPKTNIHFGISYVKWLGRFFRKHFPSAGDEQIFKWSIVAYNMGPTRVKRRLESGSFWKSHSYFNKVVSRYKRLSSIKFENVVDQRLAYNWKNTGM